MWRANFNNRTVLVLCFIISSFISVSALAKEEGVLDTGMVNPGYVEKPDWFKVSFLDIDEDIAEAAVGKRRVMLYFYQDGCPYCKKLLEDNFGQREIAELTQQYFDVIPINIWGDREVTIGGKTVTEKQFAEALKVQFTPTLIFFNKNKQAVYRANGYYSPEKFIHVLNYIGLKKETQISFLDYQARHPIKGAATGKLHKDITSIKDASDLESALENDRHLLVMFEQASCAACDELHLDILKRDESRALLKKFNVVVLDMWSQASIEIPDGSEQKIRDWAKQLDIKYAPTMVYFNEDGKEVFRSDGYLKAFHVQSVMEYVASNAYKTQPNFQRYIEDHAARLREQGEVIDLMK